MVDGLTAWRWHRAAGRGCAVGLAVLVGAQVLGRIAAAWPETPHAFWVLGSLLRSR